MFPPALVLLFFLPAAATQAPPPHRAPAGAAAFDRLAQEAGEARQARETVQAIALYSRALKLKPEWKEGWWYLGTLYYEQDKFPECRNSFQRLTLLEKQGAAGWSMLGLCEFGAKEYDLALAHLRQGQQLGVSGVPGIDEVARYHLALLLTRGESYEKSLDLFLELAQSGKDDPAMIAAAGIAALRKPLLPEDVPSAERELAYLAGQAVWDIGARRPSQAQKDFEALLAKYPNAPGVHYLYGSYLLQQEPDKAIPELQKEIQISPDHVPARVQIAFEYLRREEFAKGIPYAQEAARLAPDAAIVHTALGRLLAESGDLKGGVAELERAEKLAPDSPQPSIALASAYAKMGRNEDAARERREFLRLRNLYKKPGEQ